MKRAAERLNVVHGHGSRLGQATVPANIGAGCGQDRAMSDRGRQGGALRRPSGIRARRPRRHLVAATVVAMLATSVPAPGAGAASAPATVRVRP